MSELKVYGMNDPEVGDEYEMYKVSEVDKVLADLEESHKREVEQLLMEIVKLKQQIEILQKDKKIIQDLYQGEKYDCRIWASRAIHNKRKRCLALARIANDDFHLSHTFYQMGRKEFEKRKCERYNRHHFKWLAIADKFKEAK